MMMWREEESQLLFSFQWTYFPLCRFSNFETVENITKPD